jgi:hypothetical protein
MFVLKKKGTNTYVRAYNNHSRNNNERFTTNINEAKTYLNLDDLGGYITSEYNVETRTWVRYFTDDFNIVEVEIKEKKTYTNLRRK